MSTTHRTSIDVAHLTPQQKDRIRQLYATGMLTMLTLAQRFGCAKATVSAVVNGRRGRKQ